MRGGGETIGRLLVGKKKGEEEGVLDEDVGKEGEGEGEGNKDGEGEGVN